MKMSKIEDVQTETEADNMLTAREGGTEEVTASFKDDDISSRTVLHVCLLM